ncbi:MAG: M3 family oligoendopeptidase [Deltaproteobacteria bacterium]|jgi:oligoendopeptidase F|nr:M3 family oligoendopeptidase [Deltaproteobacteria bacterium]
MTTNQQPNEKLPGWDLSDLYKSIDDPQIEKDLAEYKELNLEFAKRYKDKIALLQTQEIFEMFQMYEQQDIIGKVLNDFACLNMVTQMTNEVAVSFYQNINEKIAEYGKPTIFFKIELNKISQNKVDEWLADEQVKYYAPAIKYIRKFKDYQLTEEVAEVLQEKFVTSTLGWVRLQQEHSARQKYIVNGETYSQATVWRSYLEQDETIRKNTNAEINRINKENSPLLTLAYNMIVKDKAIEDKLCGFESPVEKQNITNGIENEVVETLVDIVRENYKNISHRFYKLKAKCLGVEKIQFWELGRPIIWEQKKQYSWNEAVQIVSAVYREFSPKLYEIAKQFFDNPWIDVPSAAGKYSGNFGYYVSGNHHPYISLNWSGQGRDILVLAHELGHGCHHILSKKYGNLNNNTPLTLMETASIFSEMLTFQSILKNTTADKAKLCLIADKVSYMLYTSCSTIASHCFEKRVHNERKKGELSESRLGEIWLEEERAYFGPYVQLNDDKQYGWSSDSRFFNMPFYVYSYSFADCLVNSLYKVYQDKSVPDFEEKYLTLLSETGIKNYKELLKPFGLDASRKDFWGNGLKLISDYIDELEELAKSIKF